MKRPSKQLKPPTYYFNHYKYSKHSLQLKKRNMEKGWFHEQVDIDSEDCFFEIAKILVSSYNSYKK